jgi:catechol 2,3-dioxygenase-like lactoylglutathione lyase family enzyme
MPTLRAPPAAVLFVHDVERMAAFYRGVFGMRAVLTEPDIAVLELDGFQLTIHRIRGAGTDFRTREDCYVKLCFPVDDLAATRETRRHARRRAVGRIARMGRRRARVSRVRRAGSRRQCLPGEGDAGRTASPRPDP